ncbi:hypothetical protein [Azonexus hydrophilus]|uniref:hypothetical protein n=1 Tax=Azonexus hydrophilus TaxID=418702 RepID=UPI0019647DE5|nr:hypothetical protein [Azonexus hydrophilus]
MSPFKINNLFARSALVLLSVAGGSFFIVYLLNDWFHESLLPQLGLSSPVGDAVGSTLIVITTGIALSLVSLAVFRDMTYGLENVQSSAVSKFAAATALAEEVARELENFSRFNDVLRKQLDGIVDATEKAAFDITERLQAVDNVITRLDSFVTQTVAASSELASDSEHEIKDNQALISKMGNYIRKRIEEARKD